MSPLKDKNANKQEKFKRDKHEWCHHELKNNAESRTTAKDLTTPPRALQSLLERPENPVHRAPSACLMYSGVASS